MIKLIRTPHELYEKITSKEAIPATEAQMIEIELLFHIASSLEDLKKELKKIQMGQIMVTLIFTISKKR